MASVASSCRAVELVRRHQLGAFVVLAYALSWSPWLWSRFGSGDGGLLPVGPFLAALVVLGVVGGRPAVAAWLRKIVHWRVGVGWYALVLLGPPAVTLTAAAITVATGATPVPDASTPGPGAVAAQFGLVLLWGLGEEPARRGYALPRLMTRRGPLAAALLLGLIHIGWHLPLFGVEYGLAVAATGLPLSHVPIHAIAPHHRPDGTRSTTTRRSARRNGRR